MITDGYYRSNFSNILEKYLENKNLYPFWNTIEENRDRKIKMLVA